MDDFVVKFDVSKITAQEIGEFLTANNRGQIEDVAVALAQCCTSCPKEWGKPHDFETFADLDTEDYVEVVIAFTEAGRKAQESIQFDVEYNLRGVKAREFGSKFLQPVQRGDIAAVSGFFASVITKCPEAWGAPGDVQTYLHLPYYTAFLPLANQIIREVNSPKKSKRRLPSG
jgi:hypothetical protein